MQRSVRGSAHLPELLGGRRVSAGARAGAQVDRVPAGALLMTLDLRERLYEHLLGLELSFFDRQQTGQLMSRATVDLQGVRFFLGYGLIFFFQNILTVLSVTAVLFFVEWRLALIALGGGFLEPLADLFLGLSRMDFEEHGLSMVIPDGALRNGIHAAAYLDIE